MRILLSLMAALVMNASVFAESDSCRLIVHTNYKAGNKKVSFEDVEAASHAECKQAAKNRQTASEEEANVKVAFKFREKAPNLGPIEASVW